MYNYVSTCIASFCGKHNKKHEITEVLVTALLLSDNYSLAIINYIVREGTSKQTNKQICGEHIVPQGLVIIFCIFNQNAIK